MKNELLIKFINLIIINKFNKNVNYIKMEKDSFKCVCNESQDKKSFKEHFKECPLFKKNFEDIDNKISISLKKYDSLLVKNFLLRYIKLIEAKIKKEKEQEKFNEAQNQKNELKMVAIQSENNIALDKNETDWKIAIEPRRKLSSNNHITSALRNRKPLGSEINDNNNDNNDEVDFDLKKIYIGPDITDENFKIISSHCNDKIKTKNKQNKISREIAEFLKKKFWK
jgi:hypothetical protein